MYTDPPLLLQFQFLMIWLDLLRPVVRLLKSRNQVSRACSRLFLVMFTRKPFERAELSLSLGQKKKSSYWTAPKNGAETRCGRD